MIERALGRGEEGCMPSAYLPSSAHSDWCYLCFSSQPGRLDLHSWLPWSLHNCKSFSYKTGVCLLCAFESFGTACKFTSPSRYPADCLMWRDRHPGRLLLPLFFCLLSPLQPLSTHTCCHAKAVLLFLSCECCHLLRAYHELVSCTAQWSKTVTN